MRVLARKTKAGKQTVAGISGIRVSGFKSIDKEQSIEIRPLTILAGANSSGKSSIMQPLLMLKQTLEAPFDPGPLLLNGEHVKSSGSGDFLSRTRSPESPREFSVAIRHGDGMETEVAFVERDGQGLDVERTTLFVDGQPRTVRRDMNESEIAEFLRQEGLDIAEKYHRELIRKTGGADIPPEWVVGRVRSFLELVLTAPNMDGLQGYRVSPAGRLFEHLLKLIHLPALRGNSERTYPKVATNGTRYHGPFDIYAASLIYEWQTYLDFGHPCRGQLVNALKQLELTSEIAAELDETHIVLKVDRLPARSKGGKPDLVNIADVGVGVSQVVPALVALFAATQGQLVYIEQPEIHLHPRAQTALAEIIAEAAKRGVVVVIETHSPLLILAIQSLVAEGELDSDIAKLHWFERDRRGSTRVTSASLDDAGAFGDWPEDFADVTLELQQRYIEAAFSRMPH